MHATKTCRTGKRRHAQPHIALKREWQSTLAHFHVGKHMRSMLCTPGHTHARIAIFVVANCCIHIQPTTYSAVHTIIHSLSWQTIAWMRRDQIVKTQPSTRSYILCGGPRETRSDKKDSQFPRATRRRPGGVRACWQSACCLRARA